MNHQKIRAWGTGILVAVWIVLTAFLWFGQRKDVSEAERRPLAQMPQLTTEQIFSGKFMTAFEDFSLDQFPLRDAFRKVKSLFHYYVLGQKDNNGIYLADGFAVKQEYPLNSESVDYALGRFEHLYQKHLQDQVGNIYMTVVPDKGYYLAAANGYLSMDYEAMSAQIKDGMPWAEYVDITDTLTAQDYYFTDTHWRQEKLLPAAQRLCQALGIPTPREEDYSTVALPRPFYGVYYGQAALPMNPETIYYLNSRLLEDCSVYDYESGKTVDVYDMERLNSRDLYDVFLSGSRSLLTIENPNAQTDKELIVFRDSFGSAMVPLLVQGYARVTLVDIRYIQIDVLQHFLEFNGQDVLLMYSTLVLNNSSTIK